MDLEKIIKLGQSLGYEQNDLRTFVKEQTELEREKEKEKLEREERAREREIKILELEERKEREKLEWEKEKLRVQSEERIELAKLEKSYAGNYEGQVGEKQSGAAPKMPKMPPFEDRNDNIDAYLQRFERVAVAQGWKPCHWAAYLCTLLKGKALEVYSRLSVDDAEDYTAVKTALLKRYEMTEDGFHQKFRTAKTDTGEIFTQFVVRIENYFNRWIELSGTQKTFEGVKDLLLREQILNVTGRDLSIFLKERKPKDAMEMARLAEQFIEARGTGPVRYGKQGSFGQHDKTEVQGKPGENKAPGGTKPKPFIPIKERTCYNCSQIGHLAAQCKKPKYNVASIQVSEYTSNVSAVLPDCIDVEARIPEVVDGDATTSERVSEPDVASGSMFTTDHNMPIHKGKVNGKPVDVLRDSGCTGVIVRRSKVEDECLSSETQSCKLADSRVLILPVAWITVDTPFYTGKVRAACMDTPLCDLILGNIPGVREPSDPDQTWDKDDIQMVSAVETRGQRRVRQEGMKPLKALKPVGLTLSRGEFITQQQQDSSLDKVRKLVEEGKIRETRHSTSSYYIENDMLYRKHTFTKFDKGKQVVQAVVPVGLRTQVMKVSHEALMGGHLGIKKTLDRVMSQFYWPGIMGDVRRHVLSCDICQRTTPKGKVRRIPLGQMPLIEVPFERIAVDLIGPLYPVTDKGNRYLLTVVDYATRYPEAVPLPRIETEYVAEALFEIFSRVGIPKEILTDMGAQFTSGVMKEVSRLLSLHQLTTTPYHPMCNGLVEKFNGTLKTMLKRMCAERPYDWDRYVAALLFAYREVPQESLGFAPFELLYGRTVRGPVQILREIWTKDIQNPEVRTTYEYVLDLQNRLEDTIHIAQQELKKKSGKYKKFFDAEPIPLADSVFARLRHCKYLTKIDVSKAYWQIPMEESSKELTAFITPDGLYQWKVMPFGVVNAPAVFSRLMRQVLHSIPNTDNYIDDIIEGTEEWSPHVVSLRDIFTRLRQFHLTARPSKVKIGYKQLEFLGHRVGSGLIQPEGKNVEKILNVERPQTKKQVRALLGLTGYYRKFIPNYAAIAVPLTDLTKKGKSNKVVWTESQELAFTTLKTHMSSFPILKLPDLEKTFLVRSDASDVGIGAVLLQEQEGERFPIMYVSRKLAERERAYSTIEKECLAIVWAIQKLERYLYGREFILETDHQPLVWMTKAKLTNGRVMRWALTLQPYRFLIRAIKGIENVGADLLSRCSP
ncbi:uncharacterized protein [Haliotis cracherodii]|uniref:uncharacterized protein n=1 Tax=Haliotis cracherodii TaxID=6455 RepID=UPI0039E9630E